MFHKIFIFETTYFEMRGRLGWLERIAAGVVIAGGILIGGCPSTKPEDNGPGVVDDTAPSLAKIISASEFHSNEGNIYRFSPKVKLERGDFFVITEGAGALRRIVGSPYLKNGLLYTETEQATIADVVKNGNFEFVAGKEDLRALEMNIADWNYSFEDYSLVDRGQTFSAFLSGKFNGNLKLKLDFEIEEHRLKELSCSLEGSVSTNMNLDATLLEFGLEGNEEKTLVDKSWYFYGLVGGWLPVVVELQGELVVGGAAMMEGSGEIDATFAASSSLKLGGKYERGRGWNPIANESFEISQDDREFCISGRASVAGTLEPRFTVRVYGMDVASTGIEGYARMSMYGANCWSDEGIERGYRLELNAGARIPVEIGAKIFETGVEIYKNDDVLDGRVSYNWTYGNFSVPYPGSEEFYGDSYFSNRPSSGGGSDGGGTAQCDITESEPNNSSSMADRLKLCDTSTIRGRIDPDDTDYFILYATAGSVLTFSSSPSDDSGGPSLIFDGKYVGPGSAYDPFRVEKSGDYTLRGYQTVPSETKNYTITVNIN